MLALCCSMLRYSMLCTWYSIGGDVPPVPHYLVIVPGLGEDPMLARTLLLYAQVQHAVYVVQYRMRYATCTTLPGDCAWAVGGPYAGTLLLYAQVQHAVYCWYSIRGNVPPVPPFLVTVPGVGEDPMLLYALVQHAVYVVQYCIGGDMPPLPLNPVTVPGVGGTCMVG